MEQKIREGTSIKINCFNVKQGLEYFLGGGGGY